MRIERRAGTVYDCESCFIGLLSLSGLGPTAAGVWVDFGSHEAGVGAYSWSLLPSRTIS